jgi:hypothetical protein
VTQAVFYRDLSPKRMLETGPVLEMTPEIEKPEEL